MIAFGSAVKSGPIRWKTGAVVDGGAECQTGGGNRNLHLITHQLTDPTGHLPMSVVVPESRSGQVTAASAFAWGSGAKSMSTAATALPAAASMPACSMAT